VVLGVRLRGGVKNTLCTRTTDTTNITNNNHQHHTVHRRHRCTSARQCNTALQVHCTAPTALHYTHCTASTALHCTAPTALHCIASTALHYTALATVDINCQLSAVNCMTSEDGTFYTVDIWQLSTLETMSLLVTR
jgi:hypothetical protein